MNLSQIETFLIDYGQAISTGQTDHIAQLWAIPSLVVSDFGTLSVTNAEQVKDFFTQAVKSYHEKGIMSTRPEVLRFEKLSDNLYSVDVSWPGYDANDEEIESSREFSRYILSHATDGSLQIAVSITRAIG